MLLKCMPIEEVYAQCWYSWCGSLLLATSIRPEPGNPESGIAMHTHRCFFEQSELTLITLIILLFSGCKIMYTITCCHWLSQPLHTHTSTANIKSYTYAL